MLPTHRTILASCSSKDPNRLAVAQYSEAVPLELDQQLMNSANDIKRHVARGPAGVE